jgi:hypothetical protein
MANASAGWFIDNIVDTVQNGGLTKRAVTVYSPAVKPVKFKDLQRQVPELGVDLIQYM